MAAADVRERAREILGHRTLLPGQSEAVRAAVAGRDTLALLPTGGGKSAIYQLAGLERPGPTLIITPLVALQQDQLDGLLELGLSAAVLNSGIPKAEREATLAAYEGGRIEFLLLAPEQLANEEVLARLRKAAPSLFVVDEAHCVSEWGHDFRPEYRRLGRVRNALGGPPLLALTGTASPPVREDITRWLDLVDPIVVARGFDRPELFLSIAYHSDGQHKRSALVEWLQGAERPGIVYVATRRAATDVASTLAAAGIDAQPYHAGLAGRRREEVLDRFMADRLEIVVATIAFGMGVDKANVRFVVHHDPPDSLDAYHQEIGRAGRDGGHAQARLFFDPFDLGLRRFQAIPPPLSRRDVERVLDRLAAGPAVLGALAATTRVSGRRVEQIAGRLEELGLVDIAADGSVALRDGGVASAEGVAGDVIEGQERRRRQAASRVELLRGYAETRGCRRRFLLNALGEEFEPPCRRCDNCAAGGGEPVDEPSALVRLNEAVFHAVFGRGEVSRVEADRVTVRFEKVGYRTLALPDAIDDGLLRRASERR